MRYIEAQVKKDLNEKMVFVGGPRQVGKTTFSLDLIRAKNKEDEAYLNWDVAKDRKKMRTMNLPFDSPLIILDEVHKYKKWRSLVKGMYDKHFPKNHFLITGSARLDYYRFGGDSLQGRYHYHRLHPFSLREYSKNPDKSDLENLLKFGGFPEPLHKSNEKQLRRWQTEYFERVIQDDIRDLENVKNLSSLGLLSDELPNRIGSILSIKNLSEDLEVSFQTMEKWVQIFERLYICFRLMPYGMNKIRAVKKEKKLFLWDWSHVPDPSNRYENMVASQLLKYCHFLEDTEGFRMELKFLRDIDKREIDFIVTKDKKPLFAVEVKTGEKNLSPHIPYFSQRTEIPYFYQVHLGEKKKKYPDLRAKILPWIDFVKELNMP